LHLAAIGVRKAGDALPSIWVDAAKLIWAFWFVVPFMLGATAVASERQFGTSDSQLCLPEPRRAQFVVKLLFVLVVGLAFGGVMPLLMEQFARAVAVQSDLIEGSTLLDPGTTLRRLWVYGRYP